MDDRSRAAADAREARSVPRGAAFATDHTCADDIPGFLITASRQHDR